jgi:hypothetical protein
MDLFITGFLDQRMERARPLLFVDDAPFPS